MSQSAAKATATTLEEPATALGLELSANNWRNSVSTTRKIFAFLARSLCTWCWPSYLKSAARRTSLFASTTRRAPAGPTLLTDPRDPPSSASGRTFSVAGVGAAALAVLMVQQAATVADMAAILMERTAATLIGEEMATAHPVEALMEHMVAEIATVHTTDRAETHMVEIATVDPTAPRMVVEKATVHTADLAEVRMVARIATVDPVEPHMVVEIATALQGAVLMEAMGLEIATVHTADPAEARMVVEIATAEKMATVLMVKAHMKVEIATALIEAHI